MQNQSIPAQDPFGQEPELLVTAGQHTAVNMFTGLVQTARHVMEADNTRSRWANRKEAAVEGGVGDWDEVVTRQPNVGKLLCTNTKNQVLLF